MLFDLSQIELNKQRARRIGRKNFLLHSVCKNLQIRVDELGLNFKKVMVIGAKKRDFPKLDRKLSVEFFDHLEQSFVKEKFDLILNVLNLHWSNSPKEDLSIQMDFLKPGGVFMGCLYGASTLNELRDSFFKAEVKISGEAHPRISPLPEIRDIGNLAQNVGMKSVVADKELITFKYERVRELLKNLRAMGETNSILGRKNTFSRRDVFDLMEKYYQKNYPFKNVNINKCKIRATFEIIYLYGKKNKKDF